MLGSVGASDLLPPHQPVHVHKWILVLESLKRNIGEPPHHSGSLSHLSQLLDSIYSSKLLPVPPLEVCNILTKAKNLMKELCDPANDDGFIPFKPFLEKMCAAEK